MEGREEIKGKKVVLRFFDPLYVTPEWLTPIDIAGMSYYHFIFIYAVERSEYEDDDEMKRVFYLMPLSDGLGNG